MNNIDEKNFTLPKYISPLFILMLLGLLLRIVVMIVSNETLNDLEAYKTISQKIVEGGFNNFYNINNSTINYSPIHIYILYVFGNIVTIFNIPPEYTNYLIKLPAIMSDLVIIFVLFKISSKKFEANKSFYITLFYALNPAIILNSSSWGQIDSIYTLFLVLSICFITQFKLYKKTIGYLFYLLAVLTKPYLIILLPVFLVSFLIILFNKNYTPINKLLFFLTTILIVPAAFYSILLPFISNHDFSIIIELFMAPFDSFNYASIYAYNFQALLGGNYIPAIGLSPLGISYYMIGLTSLSIIIIISIIYLIRNKDFSATFFFCVSFITAGYFIWGTGTTERFLYPSLIFLLLSYVYSTNKEFLVLFFGFTITLFINCSDVLRMYGLDNNQDVIKYGISIIPFINFTLFFNMILMSFDKTKNKVELDNNNLNNKYFTIKPLNPSSPLKLSKFKVIDYIFIIFLTLTYSVIALYNMGSNNNPQSTFVGYKQDKVFVEFQEPTTIFKISTLLGARNNKDITMIYNDYNTKKEISIDINYKSVFKWEVTDTNIFTDKITILFNSDETMIQELAFIDINNNVIIPHVVSENLNSAKERIHVNPPFTENYTGLFDEPELVQTFSNYKNSTYFDEIYHPRTGYEFANSLKVYEYTHPPLGKVFMSIFIDKLGMNPLAYRLPGIIAGILMVPLMYLFGRAMFKNSAWALFVATIFTFDFMHFTQTRIATIDSFITLSVIAMFYFMYKFYDSNYFSTPLKKTMGTLLLSGLFMGMGIASKWTGIYAGAGLAIIFFKAIFERYREYLYAKTYWDKETVKTIYPFYSLTKLICFSCILFFIVVPVSIYVLSYIPYMDTPSMTDGFNGILRNQSDMLNYHGDLKSTHPYMSSWWTWPIIVRPIFYYSRLYSNAVAGISAFGNPALWWTGIVALFYTISKINSHHKKDAWFLLIAYFAQYLPWILVSRTTYIYHYFPSTPFVALMVAFMFKDIFKAVKNFWVIFYLILVVVLFGLFYPVLSGVPVPDWYPSILLKWFDTWVLVPGR